MRTKIRNALNIKPGMVIRLEYSTQPFREVATVTRGPWPNTRTITFTDGTGEWYGRSTDFQVVRGKNSRRTPRARLVLANRGFADAAFALVGAYLAAVGGTR